MQPLQYKGFRSFGRGVRAAIYQGLWSRPFQVPAVGLAHASNTNAHAGFSRFAIIFPRFCAHREAPLEAFFFGFGTTPTGNYLVATIAAIVPIWDCPDSGLPNYRHSDFIFGQNSVRVVNLLTPQMIKLFQSFLTTMKAKFNRISKATKNEKEVEDLHNDAYVLALDIGDRRGRPVDLSDPEDQDLVMRELYLENVKRADFRMRYAVRIDEEPEGEGPGISWVERLPAAASSDPLISLLAQESAVDVEAKLAERYSQATAYAITFGNFKNDRQKVCAHLVISDWALYRRVTSAIHTVKVQPSMFDRVERIPADFMPLQGKAYVAAGKDKREAGQWAWSF